MAAPYRALSRDATLLALLLLPAACGSSGSPVALSNVPRNLSYAQNPLALALDVPAGAAAPRLLGVATQWKVTPQLPLGLALDPLDGTISGTPKVLAAKAPYKVTAIGNYGSTSTDLEIAVTLPAQNAILASGSSRLVAVSAPAANVGAWLPPSGLALPARPRAAAYSPFANVTLVVLEDGSVQALRVDAGSFAPAPLMRSPVEADSNAITVTDDLAILTAGTPQKVVVYRVDATDGTLRALASADTDLDPGSVAVARGGKDVLVVCRGSETLMRFRLDRDAAKLLLVEQIRLGLGASRIAVVDGSAIGASSGLAVVTNSKAGTLDTFAIAASNGDLAALRRVPVGGQPIAVTIDPTLGRVLVLATDPAVLIAFAVGPDLALVESARVALTTPADELTLSVDAREALLSSTATGTLQSFAVDGGGALLRGRTLAQAPGTNVVVSLPAAATAPLSTRGFLAIDRDAGTLVEVPVTGQGRVFRLGAGPTALAVDRTSAFALLACRGDDSLWRIRLDPTNARVTTIEGPVTIRGGLSALVVDPAGRFAYASCDQANEIVTIALGGALPSVIRRSAAGVAPRALAIDPHGRFLAAAVTGWAQLDLYYVDPATGIPLGISYAPSGSDPREITFDLSGRHVYVASASDRSLLGYAIDDATGALSKVADRQFTAGPASLVALEEGLAVADNGASLASGLLADAESGELLTSEAVATQPGITRLVAEPTRSGFWVVSAANRAAQRIGRSPTTGKLTVLETIALGFTPLDLVVLATR